MGSRPLSNRRKLRPQNPVTAQLAAIDGAHLPGGCLHCDAYQVIHANAHGADIHTITVYHDDDCCELAARREHVQGAYPHRHETIEDVSDCQTCIDRAADLRVLSGN
jgi:hypothetical protein